MPPKLYWQMVAEVEAEREELQRRLAVTREASLLAETLSFEDMASGASGRNGRTSGVGPSSSSVRSASWSSPWASWRA